MFTDDLRPRMPGDEGVGDCDVLVVDDEIFHRDLVASMLEAKGLKVKTVGSAIDAIQIYPKFKVKPVVLMDNIMPKLSGIDATLHIRGIDPKAKIIFVSSDVAHRDDALKAGALGFVTKPFKVAEVLAAVRWAQSYTMPDAEDRSGQAAEGA